MPQAPEQLRSQRIICEQYNAIRSLSAYPTVWEKLRYTVRSLIVSQGNDTDALVGLCWVLFDDNMKALGLNNLIACYHAWLARQQANMVITDTADDDQ